MSSVSEKRTSLEYGFRPAINPSQSFQDFIRNIPDQAIHNQWPQKHSEFKKPYLADSYQDMDYIWENRPLFSLPDYPIPRPPGVSPYPVPDPGDGPRYPIPTSPGAPEYPVPSPGDGPQYPVPDPPVSPYFPVPRIPRPPAPPPAVPSPGDDPPGYIFIDRKCCGHGLRLSGPSTVAPEGVVAISVSGGNPLCEYRVKADIGSFDTWYGMDFVGGGSASFDWTAPNSPGKTAKITIEPYYTNWSLDDCLEISIVVAGCGVSHIDYTTQQMSVNETQNLTVGDPTSGVTYTWEVTSGGGSVSPLTGTSTTYTAPATNAECANNATITLKSGDEVCDTLQIAINAWTGNELAWYFWSDKRCVSEGAGCYVTNRGYNCSGTLIYGPCEIGKQVIIGCPGCYADTTVGLYGCGATAGLSINGHEANSPMDKRGAPMITGGCCPAVLL